MIGTDGRLDTDALLAALTQDGWLDEPTRRDAAARLSRASSEQHPVNRIAALELRRADQTETKIGAEALTRWLAEHCELPYRKIDPLKIDIPRVTAITPYAFAARAQILPLEVTRHTATFAVTQPGLRDWEKDLGGAIPQKIERVIANPADISRFLVEFYALSRSIKASEKEQRGNHGTAQNLEQLLELGRRGNVDANDQHIVGIVDWLLQYAYDQRASDIHLEPRRDVGNVRFRIDGVMHQVYQMPPKVMGSVCSRLKILARMDLAEKRRPQDGRVKTRSPEGDEVELRLSTMPTTFGEKLVMRIFDPDALLKDYGALGLDETQIERWRVMTGHPHGIVLVTGPTGSGKTTTLYSTLRQLASDEVNVCTIEDPIELVEPRFNQMQVNRTLDLTFASGVRTVLRQDPDIIMVGEIRDLETAEIAIQAALTGHLVLSTLHTNDAPSAITRLLDLGVPAYLLRATILGVLAQRLVRGLCRHCARPQAPDATLWRELAGPDRPVPETVQAPVGCLECRATGYLGRIGLFEMLEIDGEFRRQIDTQGDTAALRQAARQQGMVPLRQAGIQKILRGDTSLTEVLRVTPPSQE